jgi:hypothetical protein
MYAALHRPGLLKAIDSQPGNAENAEAGWERERNGPGPEKSEPCVPNGKTGKIESFFYLRTVRCDR